MNIKVDSWIEKKNAALKVGMLYKDLISSL